MPKEIFKLLKYVWVAGKQLDISRVGDKSPASRQQRSKPKSANRKKPDKRAKKSVKKKVKKKARKQ